MSLFGSLIYNLANMKIRNNSDVLSLPANTIPDPVSNENSQALTLYADNLLDVQIFSEIVELLNSKSSSIEILEKLKLCNLES